MKMKRKISNLILALALIMPSTLGATPPSSISNITKIYVVCKKNEDGKVTEDFHRTPIRVPEIYLDRSTGTLYFDNPCYECSLELVIPGTDTAVYSYIIPDGDDTVQLPATLTGEYELKITRGNYVFVGEIEL